MSEFNWAMSFVPAVKETNIKPDTKTQSVIIWENMRNNNKIISETQAEAEVCNNSWIIALLSCLKLILII